jgi:hypothetical protein
VANALPSCSLSFIPIGQCFSTAGKGLSFKGYTINSIFVIAPTPTVDFELLAYSDSSCSPKTNLFDAGAVGTTCVQGNIQSSFKFCGSVEISAWLITTNAVAK